MLNFLQSIDLKFSPLFTTFLLGLTTFVLLLWNSSRKQTYWKKIGIPYVKPWPILGSFSDNFFKPHQGAEFDPYTKYGKIYGHFEGNSPVLTVAEPDIIRQILVKDFPVFSGRRTLVTGNKVIDKMLSIVRGEDWKRIRTIVSPTFTTGKIKRMMSIFNECSQTLVQNFKKFADKGEPFEIKSLYSTFTMDIIASAAFSTKIDSQNDPDNPFVRNARAVFSRTAGLRFLLLFFFPRILKFFKVNILSTSAMQFFSDATMQIIEERRKTGQTRNDFLQLLLDTSKELADGGKLDLNDKDDIAKNYGQDESEQLLKQTIYSKKSLSQDEILAQCIVFFIAGFDTTATTLALASYNLAVNPDIQEKLIKEVDDALMENNGEMTYETIQSMKYLDNVISETLRIFPPGSRLDRTADQDYKLEGQGFTIPKGMVVQIPVLSIHRDPKLYPDPEKFDPDRFTPEERAKRHQYVYLPFGHGPRNCIAMRFALMEIKVCLAHVISNFRIKRCPETKVPAEFHVVQNLLLPKEIMLRLEHRTDKVAITTAD